MKQLFILGADDPEMSAIEKLLTEVGCEVTYALDASGVRVHGGNAYRASHVTCDLRTYETIYFVECEIPADVDTYNCVSIDHHRPGDPGYGKPPADFMSASSIGQVIALLAKKRNTPTAWGRGEYAGDNSASGDFHRGRVIVSAHEATHMSASGRRYSCGWGVAPPHEFVMIAAADHCLAAAYAGRCSGVGPAELMKFRAEQRATFQKRSVDEVLKDTESTTRVLELRSCYFGGQPVDMTDKFHPELTEAACRLGVAYIATVTEPGGRVKHVLGGCTTPAIVEKFLADAKSAGKECYGDPQRGFAGAYV